MSEQEVKKQLVDAAIKMLGISRKAAELRMDALIASGMISRLGPPDGQPFHWN